MRDRPILFGSLMAGLLASACCVGPLVLGAIGLGSLGFAAWLAPARPWFLVLTALLLAIGFYLAYRPPRVSDCEPGQACEPPRSRRSQRAVLWSVTFVAVALAAYPIWGQRAGDGIARSAARDPTETGFTLDVGGMSCEACAGEIERALREVPGVIQASVDYGHGRAAIVVRKGFGEPTPLIAAVEKAGYRAGDPEPIGPGSSALGLAGQWRGRLTVSDEGETSEMIVDLDHVAGRWTGQFDLLDFGVEDYPVGVAVTGRTVTLQFSAAQIEFIGTIDEPAEVLAGVVGPGGERDSLVLRRVGDSQLSEEFLRLEVLSGDSTLVEHLSADAAELRRQFHEDRSHTRLVMLLSPT